MLPYSTAILTVLIAQAATTLLATSVLFLLWRKTTLQHLLFWMLGFLCLGLLVLGKASVLWILSWESVWAGNSIVSLTAFVGIIQPALFLAGAMRLLLERDLTNAELRKTLVPGIALAGVAALGLLWMDPVWRIVCRVSLCAAVTLACAIVARHAAGNGAKRRLGIGMAVTMIAVPVYLAVQAYYVAGMLPVPTSVWLKWSWAAGFGEIFLQSIVGFGLITWHIEAQQQATGVAWAAARKAQMSLFQARRFGAVGQRAARIAHDYNNLLTSLRGHAELACEEVEKPSVAKHLGQIGGLVDRATILTRQLLSPGRRNEACPVRMSLGDKVRRHESSLRRLLDPGTNLLIDVDRGVPEVFGDPDQIEQILLNMILNARDACPDRGTVRIALEKSSMGIARAAQLGVEPGEFALLIVEDDGCGISADAAEHVFEPFYSTKSQERGSGLGLTIAWETVRQSGGVIQLVRKHDRGTRFLIFLPAAAETREDEHGSAAGSFQSA